MTTIPQNQELLKHLMGLLSVHRSIFKQERVYQRVVALVLGEVFTFARHTVTQLLMSLGLTAQEWSAWYRLFSRQRIAVDVLTEVLLAETLVHAPPAEPYVVGVDATHIPRSSRKLPFSGWMRAPGTAPFMRGIRPGQRFVHCAFLPPVEAGYSRAIPLRFTPAPPPSAARAGVSAVPEWQAGLQAVQWVRVRLNLAERRQQLLLVLADGPKGYAALARALSLGHLAGEKSAPRFTLPDLADAGRGNWWVLTGCRKGAVPAALQAEGPAGARRELRRLVDFFGPDRVAVELWDHGDPMDSHRNDALVELAVREGLAVVATNNVHYAAPARRPPIDPNPSLFSRLNGKDTFPIQRGEYRHAVTELGLPARYRLGIQLGAGHMVGNVLVNNMENAHGPPLTRIQHAPVLRERPLGDNIPTVLGPHLFASGVADAYRKYLISDQAFGCVGQTVHVGKRHEQAVRAIVDNARNAARPRGDDRHAVAPGFEQHDPEGVAPRWQHQELGPVQHGMFVPVRENSQWPDSRPILWRESPPVILELRGGRANHEQGDVAPPSAQYTHGIGRVKSALVE